jgi:hypothetical protein
MLRRLSFQRLEPRYALAGDVAVIVADGDLLVRGDSAGNELFIDLESNGDISIVTSLGTTINGSSSFPIILPGFTGDINIELLAGDDRVVINQDYISDEGLPGSVFANLGSGDDDFVMIGPNGGAGLFGPIDVAGSVVVFGRDGNDNFHLSGPQLDGDVLFYGGDGDDDVFIEGHWQSDGIVGQMLLDMSTGDDTVLVRSTPMGSLLVRDPIGVTTGSQVRLEGLTVAGEIEMFLSIHDDNVEVRGLGDRLSAQEVTIHTGNGDDQIEIEDLSIASLLLFTGEGNEGGGFYGVTITDLHASGGQVLVDTGGGDNNVLLHLVVAETLSVWSGVGHDGVIVQDSTFTDAVFFTRDSGDVIGIHGTDIIADLSVLLSAGDDLLVMSSTTVDGNALFDGGAGADTFHNLGSNLLPRLTRVSI